VEWKTTVSGQHRISLQQRAERLAREEEARKQLDLQFKQEEQQRRAEVIQRAKMLQYQQTDAVKQFHSKISMIAAIEVYFGDKGT
jgi:DNA-binding helix-hairpin-helix protein with protein kinase domain